MMQDKQYVGGSHRYCFHIFLLKAEEVLEYDAHIYVNSDSELSFKKSRNKRKKIFVFTFPILGKQGGCIYGYTPGWPLWVLVYCLRVTVKVFWYLALRPELIPCFVYTENVLLLGSDSQQTELHVVVWKRRIWIWPIQHGCQCEGTDSCAEHQAFFQDFPDSILPMILDCNNLGTGQTPNPEKTVCSMFLPQQQEKIRI